MKSYDETFFASSIKYSVIQGLLLANEKYAKWSKNEYPLEARARDFVSGHVIEQILEDHGIENLEHTSLRFTINDDFESIAGKLGLRKQFDPSYNIHCDIVSWSDKNTPKGTIVLLEHFKETIIKEELDRIAGMLTRFGKRGGPLTWGAIAGIRGLHNQNDEDRARWYLDTFKGESSQREYAGFDITSAFKMVENLSRKSDDDYLGFAAYVLTLELKAR